jgi:uncharacterized protein (DUF952 family)
MFTLHGTALADWQTAADEYLPPAFAQDGFIHTSVGGEALAAALNRHLRGDPRPYVALLIDLDRVPARWEIARYPNDPAAYPHIHGPLPRAAVIDVLPIPRTADGEFLPPDGARN